ncbi:TetR/AcrR family transcriptional regulator [Nocardia huaxiensis]|uniref:TetR family transcriptional regulator n=1 Tax=Nocardia huaxiensis TaxID=2755382 RepID=A0A7D6V9A6_9NOCA|nr:TetR family transcriptional regulator [Nocardia huaxiensis]QLY29411.1 TetR family transcriptional regulator [Nocardia huaxiensis]UFS97107.1 TetR family transcriptional regulator [Nocardia huaxiensis]
MGNPAREQPRQERSRLRREALVRAALELIAEQGPSAVTHRGVAARAGLPGATTGYFFASVQDLIDEALALQVHDRISEFGPLLDNALATRPTLDDVLWLIATTAARSRTAVIAQFQLYLDAGRRPELEGPVTQALEQFEALAARVLRACGAVDPDAAAEQIVAMIDGFLLHRLGRPRTRAAEADSLHHALRALTLSHLAGPDRDAADQLLQRRVGP